jgi:hypothetical protein
MSWLKDWACRQTGYPNMPKEEVKATYPELEEEDITQALKYVAWVTTERTIPTPMAMGRNV